MKPKAVGWFSSESRYHQAKVSIESYRKFHGTDDTDYYLLFCGTTKELARIYVPRYVKVIFLEQMHPFYVENSHVLGTMGGFPRPLMGDYLLRQGYKRFMLLDADTEFFGNLDDLWDELAGPNPHDAIVTPHRLTPPPLDGKTVCQELFVFYGNYNSAFTMFAATADTIKFMEWWMVMSIVGREIDFARGHCAEQGWLRFICDYVPNVKICRDMGINFAFWRYDREDQFKKGEDGWYIDGQLLRLFHHSHFNPNDLPASIERHQSRAKCSPDMLEFLQRYKELL